MRRRTYTSIGSALVTFASALMIACGDVPVAPSVDFDLRGVITDASTHAGIPGATVGLYEAKTFSYSELLGSARTDATGHYVLRVRRERCFDSLIALAISADGYQDELNGYGFDPPDRSPQCRSTPQTLDVALTARTR